MIALLSVSLLAAGPRLDLEYLHGVAHEVVDASKVEPGAAVPGGGKNTTGVALRVPGGTQSYYPAFWIRDAAMMLGADLVPASEVEGWIKVVAACQPGPEGRDFAHGLRVPPYSIPDHVTLQGAACWYPGAYADQGVGDYGFLPPADDAFYFIQMVHECFRLTHKADAYRGSVDTPWGRRPLSTVCERAFDSVASDPDTGLVVCDARPGKGRVDWGFCDSISKTGSCLMPSLLRWQAAQRLADLSEAIGLRDKAHEYRTIAKQVRESIAAVFYRPLGEGRGMLLSATGLGRKDDIWAAAFAVWLRVLPPKTERAVASHLLDLYREGGAILEGQVRHLPRSGEFGGYWESARSGRDTYQNGGFWATPTGWLVVALSRVDRKAAGDLLSGYLHYLRENRARGAPFEWISPKKTVNANYASSAGLVYVALRQAGYRASGVSEGSERKQ